MNNKEQIVELNDDNFEATIGSGIVLLSCWAAWCRVCWAFRPVLEQAARRHPDHTFARLDTQREAWIVESLGIEHVPALVVFRDGLMLFNQAGTFDEEGLDGIVAQAASLAMGGSVLGPEEAIAIGACCNR
jgi:thioredoxin 1